MARSPDRLALDKASIRRVDADGHLHVGLTPISKANVCGYTGDEIMRQAANGSELNLNPDRTYKLYRDADALTKGAASSNGKPLLDVHTPVSADDHPREVVVGGTGNDAVFKFPYLYNTLSVWDGEGIDDIQSKRKRELSSSYRYTADMTPGTIGGVAFDGRMLHIDFNHVALVPEGRAGHDVLVGDSKAVFLRELTLANDEVKHDPSNGQFSSGGSSGAGSGSEKKKISVSSLKTKLEGMSHSKLMASLNNKDVDPSIKKHIEKELDSRADRGTSKGFGEDSKPMAISRSALMLQGALTGLIAPKLATDAKPDFAAIAGVTRATMKAKRPAMAKAFVAANKGKLAADEGLEVDEVVAIIEAVQGSADPTDPDDLSPTPATDEEGDDSVASMVAKIKAMSDEDRAALMEALKPAAADADKDDDRDDKSKKDGAKDKGAKDAKPGVTQVAMDAAIAAARREAQAEFAAIRNAEREVEPYVGQIAVAMDSPAAVYKFAFDTMEVDVKGVHPSAYPAILKAQRKPDADAGERLAADALSTSNDFRSRVPGASRIRLA